jgi:hypothetical protein
MPESVKAAADCTTQSYRKSALKVGSITSGGRQMHPADDVAPALLIVLGAHEEGRIFCPTQ